MFEGKTLQLQFAVAEPEVDQAYLRQEDWVQIVRENGRLPATIPVQWTLVAMTEKQQSQPTTRIGMGAVRTCCLWVARQSRFEVH
jgi:hypothetical protein